MVTLWKVMTSAVLSLIAAAPTAAQDGSETAITRTPESAHRLLQAIIDLNPPTITFPIWYFDDPGKWFTTQAEGSSLQYQSGALTSVRIAADCEWLFTIRYRGGQELDKAPIPSTGVDLEKRIDRRLVATTASGHSDSKGQAAILMRDDSRYVVSTEFEESKHIAFAFEFLRQHCLVANDTGF